MEVKNQKGQTIPTLELRDYIEEDVLEGYTSLYKNRQEIPCGNQFSEAPPHIRMPWLERLLIERLEEKARFIEEIYNCTGNNWDETFYLLLCRNFGFKVNSDCFLQLGKSIPLSLLLRQAGSVIKNEALLFGQAGLLREDAHDDYPKALLKEYRFLQGKYILPTSIPHNWKFLRMRPRNFPTVRIAQMAGFIANYQHTFSKILETENLAGVKKLFKTRTSSYWNTHYVFDEISRETEKLLGISSIENILVNTVCPLIFYYGKTRAEEQLCEKAMRWYGELKAEENHITALYENLGFNPAHAGQSQALIQLHQEYCSKKKCLECAMGVHFLKPKAESALK